ncbi:hypothetical protein LWE61_15025 [Sphingobium sufflavum]|uniref:hypothetical protein n=1 Tax=Sphingobium sufflavum TaxID=1129547 RepID=UPI001F35EC3B|nr:hypothetical protein [Sphingobium sufflavum]MCE7797863.1 hypothetical protein [Sphingobium sufflavum]
MNGFTDAEKALLTEEELAGLQELESDEADDGQQDDEGNDSDGDDGEDGAEQLSEQQKLDANDAEADAAAARAAASEAAGRDDGVAAADEDDDDDPEPVIPALKDRVDPKDIETKLADIATRADALSDKLDDGDITTKEFRAQLDALNEEKNGLTNKLAHQQQHDEGVVARWNGDVDKFLTANPDLKANKTRLMSFDTVVREVTSDPNNGGLSNRAQLKLAHAIWKEEMGIPAASAPVPKVDGQREEEPKPKPKPSKAKVELPPTLHNLPAAEHDADEDGKFGHLDALLTQGRMLDYEDALANLSKADLEDYLGRA